MTKKIRLIDEEPAEENEVSAPSNLDTEKLMKYLEAMDWKLWEMLKLMRADREETDADK